MCMRTKVNKSDDIIHMYANLKLKKAINNKPSIQIKFKLYHYISYDKIVKIRPHLDNIYIEQFYCEDGTIVPLSKINSFTFQNCS